MLRRWLILISLLGMAGPLWAGERPATSPAATRPAQQSPAVVYLPGVSGLLKPGRQMGAILLRGGFASIYRVFDWAGEDPGLDALKAYARNRNRARDLAGRLAEQRKANPGRPIDLIAHSGGAGIAVWALEDLPQNVTVRHVILLAPALSPTYDLSNALAHVSGTMIAFHSPNDWWVLGAGTKWLGTIDRVYTEAAGLKGFTRPASGRPDLYKKLVQIGYDPAWAALGNAGDHMGTLAGPFVRSVIAPLLRNDKGDIHN